MGKKTIISNEGKLPGESRFREMLDKMLEGVQIIGFDWKYIYVNEELVRQGGYSWEALKGHTMMEMYPGLEDTEVFKVLKLCMDERIQQYFVTEFTFPDGKKTWFELRIQPIPEGIFILSIDITARKKAEEKLKSNELEYYSLIEQASDAIFISDNIGRYLDVNRKACTMLGYSREELLSMNALDILWKDEAEKNPPRFEELKTGKTILSTRNFRTKDGQKIPVEINAKMLSNGKMLGMVRDISERKKAEEDLRASEDKFRNLTETAFDAIVLVDGTGTIQFWNRGAEITFGYSKEEALHRPLTFIMPEKYRTAHQQGMERYLRTGEKKVIGKVISFEGRRKSGATFPIELSITSWDGPHGKMFSGIIRDSSERIEAQKKIIRLNEDLEHKVKERTEQLERKISQLKESEEKFQKAFQASAAGITITRLADGIYLEVNDAFVGLTGYSRAELIGHTSTELKLVADLKQREAAVEQLKNEGSVKHLEMTIRDRSGRIHEVLSSIETIVISGEKYAINVIYDITERKSAEERLAAANKELEAFSYSVSHDLRAPLRSIIGYTEILQEDFAGVLNEEGNKTLAIIQQNGFKMNRLIDDLLKFSKLGKQELQKAEVNNNELVSDIVQTTRSEFEHPAQIDVKPLPNAIADRELITQVWINLISNALKYSSKRSNPHVEIGSFSNNFELIFYVKDNGAGFNMEYAGKLFGVFQRLHKPQEFEGTGVGLSIVKRIINRHNGRVWAEGKVNEGATFYFSLPARADL
jgi:PAS domain S-box-containing protein